VIKSRGEGDSAFAVFDRASSAIVAAYELQRSIAVTSSLKVRAAIHTGEAVVRGGDYYGVVPNRTARLRSLAHGGQIVVSRVSADLAEPELIEPISLVRLGTYRVRDWPSAQELFGVRGPGIESEFPPLQIWGDKDRAVMTIVTVDMIGSSSYASDSSHTELVGFVSAMSRGISEMFAAHTGSFLKLMGDGCLALFEDPVSALGFARSVSRWMGPSRISMHTGIIELVEDDAVGRAIFEAFHLAKTAEPGRIAVSGITAELLAGHEIAFDERPDGVLLMTVQG
jgi:class 3 adenylate cyclase